MLRTYSRIVVPLAVMYISVAPAALAGAASWRGQAQGPEKRIPSPAKGTAIVVSGCLKDATIEEVSTGRIFRLTGDKKTIKELMKAHDGHVDDVSGILKSNLLQPVERSRRIGKTKIIIGATESRNTPTEGLPILSVKSFEHTGEMCKG